MSNYCGATARAVDISLSETAAAAGDAADRYCSQATMFCLFRIKCSRTSMADKNKKKIKYNAITHAHTDTQNYKHTHTPPRRYNHGEDLILITNGQTSS